MRVELAKLLLMKPDLLLLDEPTNHLDIESIEWLESFLTHHPGAILLISHDRVFLDTLTKRTVEIGGAKLYDFKGPYSKYQVWREEERERQTQAAKNQQKYIQETEQLINKFRAKKNKAAFAQSLIKKLDKLERLEVDAAENAQIRFRFPPAPRTGKVIFEAKTLKKQFGDLTVLQTLEEVAVGDVRKQLRGLLGSFLFSGEDVDKKVKVLSGGEKARLALCKLLLHPYNVLILDEPTNHLDLKSKTVLKQALKGFDGSLVVVSHDRDFLSDMTQLVYEVTPQGLKQYIGDIKQFLHEKHAASISAYEANKAVKVSKTTKEKSNGKSAPPQEDYKARKARDKAIRKERNAVERLEKKVVALEEKIGVHNEAMAAVDPSDRAKVTELAYAFEAVQKEMQEVVNQWERAVEELERLQTEAAST